MIVTNTTATPHTSLIRTTGRDIRAPPDPEQRRRD